MMTTLTSIGGFVGTPILVPSRTFLQNLENLSDQAKRSMEEGGKLAGVSFGVIPKLFWTKPAEGRQSIRPDLKSSRDFQDLASDEG